MAFTGTHQDFLTLALGAIVRVGGLVRHAGWHCPASLVPTEQP